MTYWSGTPSFRIGSRYVPGCDRDEDIEYEMALDDLNSIADDIEKLTGKRPATTDVKARQNDHFCEVIMPVLAGKKK